MRLDDLEMKDDDDLDTPRAMRETVEVSVGVFGSCLHPNAHCFPKYDIFSCVQRPPQRAALDLLKKWTPQWNVVAALQRQQVLGVLLFILICTLGSIFVIGQRWRCGPLRPCTDVESTLKQRTLAGRVQRQSRSTRRISMWRSCCAVPRCQHITSGPRA